MNFQTSRHRQLFQFMALFLSALMISPGAFAQTSGKTHSRTKKQATNDPPADPYPPLLIGPGDLLTIDVVGFDRSIGGMVSSSGGSGGSGSGSSSGSGLPDTYLVDSNGEIFYPFVGEVDLKGLSQIDASLFLMKKLKGYLKFPQVSVLIQSSNTYNVSVLGDVTKPGQFMIRGKPDLLTMLSQAGGPGPNPDLGGVLLTRGTTKLHIDLGKLLSDKDYHETAPTVYPGDIIYVPQSGWPTLAEISIILGLALTSTVLIIDVTKH
jgi:protein involved in polysaccharide export with SLBB domain